MQTQIVLLQRITVLQLCNISWSCLCGDGKTYQLGCKTEDEMVWHHQLDGHEFEHVQEVGDGLGRPGVLQSLGLQTVRYD